MTVKGFLMWNISALRDGGSTYPYGHLRSIPTHHPFPPRECFCRTSVSQWFLRSKISCTVSIPSLTVTANCSCHVLALSVVCMHFNIPFVFCERSRPTNKRNREQKYITKKQALSTKMELFQILCIHFDHKCGTELVSSNTLWNTKPISL